MNCFSMSAFGTLTRRYGGQGGRQVAVGASQSSQVPAQEEARQALREGGPRALQAPARGDTQGYRGRALSFKDVH